MIAAPAGLSRQASSPFCFHQKEPGAAVRAACHTKAPQIKIYAPLMLPFFLPGHNRTSSAGQEAKRGAATPREGRQPRIPPPARPRSRTRGWRPRGPRGRCQRPIRARPCGGEKPPESRRSALCLALFAPRSSPGSGPAPVRRPTPPSPSRRPNAASAGGSRSRPAGAAPARRRPPVAAATT